MPRRKVNLPDRSILEAALAGLELQKQKLDEQIAQVKAMLGKKAPAAHSAEPPAAKEKPRKRLSEAARKRIAAAQKKRWAAYRASLKEQQ